MSSRNNFRRDFKRTQICVAVSVVLLGLAGQSFSLELEGIFVEDSTEDLYITNEDLILGAGLSNYDYPIVFNSDKTFSIVFDEEPGTVFISKANWPDGAINVYNKHSTNLKVANGSLNIQMSGKALESQSVITMNWGSSLSVDRDLLIDYNVTSDYFQYETWPYAAIMGGGVDVDVGGNTSIKLSRESIGKTTEILSGLYLSIDTADGNDSRPVDWNFGTPGEEGLFHIRQIQSQTSNGMALSSGIQAGGQDSNINIFQAARIENIHAYSGDKTTNATAYGIYSENTDISFTENTVIENIHAIHSGNDAYAIGAEIINAKLSFNESLTIKNISAQTGASENSVNMWTECTTGTCGDGATAYAIGSYLNAEVLINPNHKKSATVVIENDLTAGDGGKIKANFSNQNSHFYGTAVTSPGVNDLGTIELSFSNGATWRLSKSNTHPVDLTLSDSAVVYLNRNSEGQLKELAEENSSMLTLSSLSGSGLFHLSTAVDGAYGDSIYVHSGDGEYGLMIQGTGEEPISDALDRALVTVEEGSVSMVLANEGGVVDLGNYVYGLASRDTGSATEWFLTNQTTDAPTGEQVLSPSATAVLALAGSGTQVSQFLYGLSDLRKRMGDVHNKVDDGPYTMLRAGKDRISGFASTTYKDEYGAISIGFDRRLTPNWILGLNFEAIEGDQTVRSGQYKAKGESSTQALKTYLSWLGEDGTYFDWVFGLSKFDQDIRSRMLDGTGVKGSYDSWGFGASVESGHQFSFGIDQSWFVEPQLQLSYFRVQGKDFSLTNAMKIEQEDADSLTGRIGIVFGRYWQNERGIDWQFSVKGGVNHEFLDESGIRINNERFVGSTLGTRGYYGFTFDYLPTDDIRIFGQIEREVGAHYTSEINARVGVKYSF